MMLWCTIVMTLIIMEIVPPTKWYQPFSYIITWPSHLGKWIKENVERG